MIAQGDLTRLTGLVSSVTKNPTLAEDAIQDACVRLLEKGADLTPELVYSYAVKQAKTVVRSELRQRELEELATHQVLTDLGERGYAPLANTAPCEWCGRLFSPRKGGGGKTSKYTVTCSMSCGAKRRHALARQERGTHIARSN